MIKVTIECTSGENDLPSDIAKIVGHETDWRNGYIMIDHIIGFYPGKEEKYSYIITQESSLIVKESVNNIERMIWQARSEREKQNKFSI